MAERREDFRAADADRERVAQRLQAAVNEGRLSLLEYDERLREAYAAKTYGELDRLVADLPEARPEADSQLAAPAASSVSPGPDGTSASSSRQPGRRTLLGLAAIWGGWFAVVSLNVAIWLVVSITSGRPVYFWPMWIAGPWGVALLFATIARVAGAANPEHGGQPASVSGGFPGPVGQWERRAARWERRAARWGRRAQRWERRSARWDDRSGHRNHRPDR